MEVPTPSPALVPVPQMEDKLVDVPSIVPRIFPGSCVSDDAGHPWCSIVGLGGGWAHPTSQWTPLPAGCTARLGLDINTGHRGADG